MTISAKIYERMASYNIAQGENSVSIMQFCNDSNMWEQPTISASVYFGCGNVGGLSPFEMITELYTLVQEIEDVLRVLDKRAKEMGDEYEPPVYPFRDKE